MREVPKIDNFWKKDRCSKLRQLIEIIQHDTVKNLGLFLRSSKKFGSRLICKFFTYNEPCLIMPHCVFLTIAQILNIQLLSKNSYFWVLLTIKKLIANY